MDNFKLRGILLISLLAITMSSYAQCDKTGNLFGIPDGFVRNRFKTDAMLYTHPYTTFNKRDYGDASFNLKAEIDNIRVIIKRQKDQIGYVYGGSKEFCVN